MRQFLDLLDDEWKYLATSADATRALVRWAPDPALQGFPDLDAVVEEIQRRGRPAESDRILLALLHRAPLDQVAARTVLQAVMPGLKSLMSAYQLTGEPEDVSTAVIEAAFERIRSYPCDRRPARVAANLLNDTRQILWRAARKERKLRLVTEPLPEAAVERVAHQETEQSPTDELVALVAEAVRLSQVPRSGARDPPHPGAGRPHRGARRRHWYQVQDHPQASRPGGGRSGPHGGRLMATPRMNDPTPRRLEPAIDNPGRKPSSTQLLTIDEVAEC